MNDAERTQMLARVEQELERIPVCEWAKARPSGDALRAIMDDAAGRRTFLLEGDAHRRGCPTCQARYALPAQVREAHGGWFVRALARGADWAMLQPVWLQPAIVGASAFAAYSLFRIVAATLVGGIQIAVALEGLLLSASIGGGIGLVGGNAYRLLKPWGEKRGRFGPYLAGILFTATLGLATAIVLLVVPATSSTFRHPFAWEFTGVLVLLGGLGAGAAWFRPGTKFRFS